LSRFTSTPDASAPIPYNGVLAMNVVAINGAQSF